MNRLNQTYPDCVKTGLEVVGNGVRLEEGVVRDGADGVVFATKFLFQVQRMLEPGLLPWRLSTGVEQGGVCGVCGNQGPLFHLKDNTKKLIIVNNSLRS